MCVSKYQGETRQVVSAIKDLAEHAILAEKLQTETGYFENHT